MGKRLLQDPSSPLGGWKRNRGFKGSPAGTKDFEVRVMNLMAGVGREGWAGSCRGLLAHTSGWQVLLLWDLLLCCHPFSAFFLARAGEREGSTTNGQTDIYLVQDVLNFNLFSLIFIKYIL